MTDNGGGTPGNRASDADGDSWFKPSENRYRTQSEYQDPLEEDAAANPGEGSAEGAVFPDSGGYAGLSASRPAMVEPYPDALGGPPSAPGISYPGAGTSAYEPVTRFPGEDPLAVREPGYPGIAASAEVPLPPEDDSWANSRGSWEGPSPAGERTAPATGEPASAQDPWNPQESLSGHGWESGGSESSTAGHTPGAPRDPGSSSDSWDSRDSGSPLGSDSARDAWMPLASTPGSRDSEAPSGVASGAPEGSGSVGDSWSSRDSAASLGSEPYGADAAPWPSPDSGSAGELWGSDSDARPSQGSWGSEPDSGSSGDSWGSGDSDSLVSSDFAPSGAPEGSGSVGDSWSSRDSAASLGSDPYDTDAAPWRSPDSGPSGDSRGAALGQDAWSPQESAPGAVRGPAQDSGSAGELWGSDSEALSSRGSWDSVSSAIGASRDSGSSGDSWGSGDSDSLVSSDFAPSGAPEDSGSVGDSWSSRDSAASRGSDPYDTDAAPWSSPDSGPSDDSWDSAASRESDAVSDAWPSRGSWDSESSAAGYTPGASLDSGQSGDSWASGDSEPRDADAAPWSPLDPGSSGGSRGAALGPDAWLPQESAPGSAQDSDSVGDSWGSQGSLSGSDSWSPLDSAPSRGSDSLESDRAPWSSSDSGDSWDSEAPASGSSSWGPRPSGSGEGSWDSDSPLDGDAPFPTVSGPGSASDSWSSRTPDSSLDGDAPFPTVSGPGSASDAWASQGSDPLQDTWRQTGPGEELWKSDREQSSEWRGTGGLDSWSPSEDTGDTWKASGTTEPWTEQAERPWSDQTRNPSYSGDRYDDELSPRPAEGARPTDRYDDELSPPAGGTGNTWAFDRDDPRLPDVVRDAERRRRETPRDEYGDWGEDDEPDTGTLSAAVPSSEDPLAAIADMQSRARTKDHEDDPELDRDEEGDDSWRGGEGATQMFSAPSFDEDPSLGRDGPEDRYEDDPSDEDDRDRGEVETDYEDDFTPADYGMPERPKPAKRRRDKIAEDFPGFDEARDDGDYPGYDSIDFLADTEPGANVTLWLGLASVIPGLGVITAILALFVTGPKAKRAIRESRGTLDGLGLITTGTVFAVIGILVTVISVAIWFVL